KLAKYDAAKAVRRLKDAVRGLDVSVEISSEKRETLVKQLQAKIAALEGQPVADPKGEQQKEAARKTFEAARLEAKDVRDGVAEIERLHLLNRVPEANRKVAELAQKYPNNPAVLVLTGQVSVADKLAVAKDLAREQGERFVYAMNDVQRSALPAKGDI